MIAKINTSSQRSINIERCLSVSFTSFEEFLSSYHFDSQQNIILFIFGRYPLKIGDVIKLNFSTVSNFKVVFNEIDGEIISLQPATIDSSEGIEIKLINVDKKSKELLEKLYQIKRSKREKF